MPRLNRKNKTSNMIPLDVPTLNMYIKYICCNTIPFTKLMNLSNLVKLINPAAYASLPEIKEKLELLIKLEDAVVKHNYRDIDIIQDFLQKSGLDKKLIDIIPIGELTLDECNYIEKSISTNLQLSYIYDAKESLLDSLEELDRGDSNSFFRVIQNIKDQLSTLLGSIEESEASDDIMRDFSFADDSFTTLISNIVSKYKKPTHILQTGIQYLNGILSPGFMSGRLYTFLGGSGKFKSGLLINLADQIRLYNPQVAMVENKVRNTILFITAENSIEETVERIYDMYSEVEDNIRKMTAEEVITILRNKGKFQYTSESGIDILIKYFNDQELSTVKLYTLIKKLETRHRKIITCIIDYMERLSSVKDDMGNDTIRLNNVAKELKTIARNLEIPIITAMQLNREGNAILDDAIRDQKSDVSKFVGTASVGLSWGIIKESDWVALINPELQADINELFLTFKLLKIRYKKNADAPVYFNHPFSNEKNIRLAIDVDQDKPLSRLSLNSLKTVDDRVVNDNTIQRPHISQVNNKIQILKTLDMNFQQ